jgi:hypothetical protein
VAADPDAIPVDEDADRAAWHRDLGLDRAGQHIEPADQLALEIGHPDRDETGSRTEGWYVGWPQHPERAGVDARDSVRVGGIDAPSAANTRGSA